MQVVVSSGRVVTTHTDDQNVASNYAGCLILTVPDTTPVEIGQAWDVDLIAAKSAACAEIDTLAEVLRQTVLTPGSGQAAEYFLTQSEAAQYIAAVASGTTINADDFPMLQAEQAALAATGGEVSLADTAQVVLTKFQECKTSLAAIKETRRAAKEAIRMAADLSGVLAARDGANWPASSAASLE